MSDDGDPFSDLANDLESAGDDPDPETETDRSGSDDGAGEGEGDVAGEVEDPRETPAFAWSQDMQHPIYARDETWDAFQDVMLDVEYRLRREHGLSNVENREVYDAVLRAVDEDDLVAAVLEARGIDADADEE